MHTEALLRRERLRCCRAPGRPPVNKLQVQVTAGSRPTASKSEEVFKLSSTLRLKFVTKIMTSRMASPEHERSWTAEKCFGMIENLS